MTLTDECGYKVAVEARSCHMGALHAKTLGERVVREEPSGPSHADTSGKGSTDVTGEGWRQTQTNLRIGVTAGATESAAHNFRIHENMRQTHLRTTAQHNTRVSVPNLHLRLHLRPSLAILAKDRFVCLCECMRIVSVSRKPERLRCPTLSALRHKKLTLMVEQDWTPSPEKLTGAGESGPCEADACGPGQR